MNPYLAAASALCAVGALVHSVLGERLIFRPLFKLDLPKLQGSEAFMKQVLRAFWHGFSIFLGGFATLLITAATVDPLDGLGRWSIGIIQWTVLIPLALYVLIQTRGKHFAWVLFALASILIWLGLNVY
jgi:hypothetical protein